MKNLLSAGAALNREWHPSDTRLLCPEETHETDQFNSVYLRRLLCTITSSCADDFINHEEILDTLAYADQNKENSTLIDSIIQKAKKRKGLSHREASVLLACPIPEK